ncbi:MAG: methyltransferase domain-containing protein [Planctomycetes bacterium]|nr:methyltransferase domain-containing protein [Planctomycetota bacterium]
MSLTLSQLEFCRSLSGEALAAAPLPADRLAALESLRRACEPAQAAAVMTIRDLRRRARQDGKFPEAWAERLLATEPLLQQASSIRLAVYVGRRLARVAGASPVWDLCCGLGADALGIAAAGGRVRAFDRSPEAVCCARHNAAAAGLAERCTFDVADVTALDLPAGAVVHIDPDRRAAGRRVAGLANCQPGESFLRALPLRTAAGAMKLSPSLAVGEVAGWEGVAVEHVSEDGVCKQLLVWWGAAAGAARQATVVAGDGLDPRATSLQAGQAPPASVGDVGRVIIEPDAAVIAAGATDDLAARLAAGGTPAWRLAPGLDWLTADAPADTPLARCFGVLATAAGREADVAAAVRGLDGGLVEVKPRGLRLDTDALQVRLRGPGTRPLVVLWGALGARQRAFIAERIG